MRSLRLYLLLCALTLSFGCQDNIAMDKISKNLQHKSSKGGNTNFSDGIKIAILSDIHVMDPNLLVETGGSSFEAYLDKTPQLIYGDYYSLEYILPKMILLKPDLVLICGDLTKDGEKVSHEAVVRLLKLFTNSGIKVLVTPGNHDVNNPEALKYDGATTTPVETIQTADFPTIYADYGFSNAISRDPNSLSYVNEPIPGLWIVAIDANKYDENSTSSTVGGVIKPETMRWVKQQLLEAKNKGKTVIGMMHHGLIEHYAGQIQLEPGNVVDNSDETAKKLMDEGLKMILTGHSHAYDITKREHANKFIYDVETGSTVIDPFGFRMLTIQNNIFSFQATTVAERFDRGILIYQNDYLNSHFDSYFANLLMNAYGIPAAEATTASQYFRKAERAHLNGYEVIPDDFSAQLVYLNSIDPSGQLARILTTLWTDINTPDNHVSINIDTGEVL